MWKLLFIILPISSFASELCETRLLNVEELTSYRFIREESETAKTVGEMPGSHGGKLIILEKPEKYYSWYSQFSLFPGADQGDPRAAANALGVDLAYFFGLREISENRITIPDAKELNWARLKLNRSLKTLGFKPIPIRFYEQGIESHHDMTYLRKFIRFYSLPYSDKGSLRVHDASYHLMSVLLTEELLAPIVERYQWVLKFYEFVRKQKEKKFIRQMQRAYFIPHLVDRIDAGLGNLQPFFVTRTRKLLTNINGRFSIYGPDASQLDKTWKMLTVNGKSKRGMMDELITQLMEKAKVPVSLEFEWQRLHKEFIKQQSASEEFMESPYGLTTADVYHRLIKRQQEMVKALESLQMKEKP